MRRRDYITIMGYWEVENLFDEGRISREEADEAHKQHKIISEAMNESRDAESKMTGAIRILDKIKIKDNKCT